MTAVNFYTICGIVMMSCHFHLEDCGPPPQIANGSAELLRSGGLSAALYSCDFGYTLVGNGVGTCYANGTWSELPVCKQIQ